MKKHGLRYFCFRFFLLLAQTLAVREFMLSAAMSGTGFIFLVLLDSVGSLVTDVAGRCATEFWIAFYMALLLRSSCLSICVRLPASIGGSFFVSTRYFIWLFYSLFLCSPMIFAQMVWLKGQDKVAPLVSYAHAWEAMGSFNAASIYGVGWKLFWPLTILTLAFGSRPAYIAAWRFRDRIALVIAAVFVLFCFMATSAADTAFPMRCGCKTFSLRQFKS